MLFISVLVSFIALLSIFLFNNTSNRLLIEDNSPEGARLLPFYSDKDVQLCGNEKSLIMSSKPGTDFGNHSYKGLESHHFQNYMDAQIYEKITIGATKISLFEINIEKLLTKNIMYGKIWIMEYLKKKLDEQNEARINKEALVNDNQGFENAVIPTYFYSTHYKYMCFPERVYASEQDKQDKQEYIRLPTCKKPVYPVQIWSFDMWKKKSWKVIVIIYMLLTFLSLLLHFKVAITTNQSAVQKTKRFKFHNDRKTKKFMQNTQSITLEDRDKPKESSAGAMNQIKQEKSFCKENSKKCQRPGLETLNKEEKRTRQKHAREVQALIKILSQKSTMKDVSKHPEEVFKDFPNLAQFYANKGKSQINAQSQ